MDLFIFGNSFGGNFSNVSDGDILDNKTYIPLLIKPSLFAQPRDLDAESVADFNAMQLSAFSVLDTDKPQPYTQWEHVSIFSLSASTLGFIKICKSIKFKFLVNPKPWQVSIVTDITLFKKDVVIITGTSAGKSLLYQFILLITGDIVLVVSPMIALMEDQVG